MLFAMSDDSAIATHADAAAREHSNYILQLDLSQDGMPGKFEQMWTRTDDQQVFELCCIPFFTYGLSLGDKFRLNEPGGGVPRRVIERAPHD